MKDHRHRHRPRLLATALSLVASAGLAGCLGGTGDDTVTLLGIWTGAEQAEFAQVLDRFEAETGIEVVYTGARDAGNVLASDLQDGNPPELAVLQTPYELTAYAGEQLVRLDDVLDRSVLEREYDEQWRERLRGGTDSHYAVVVKVSLKGLVWHQPASLDRDGYRVPQRWDELRGLSEAIRSAGGSPWCLGLEATPSSGWPGTDWIEDILLHQAGPEAYQRWAAGELAWTSDEVRRAWQSWGELVTAPGAIHGGPHAAMVTNFSQAGRPLFGGPPGCYLHHAPSFIHGVYQGYPEAGEYDFFPLPSVAPEHSNARLVAADLMVMFRDTPAARKLINFIATAEAQQIWPSLGTGAISANTAVPADVYRDETVARVADILTDPAARVYFDASDLMPADLREAFNQAVLRYLAVPDDLPEILTDLELLRTG